MSLSKLYVNFICHISGAYDHIGYSNRFLGEALTMESILRNSSRFKKAKVSAAQSQDEESQHVDVVPDSLADTRNE